MNEECEPKAVRNKDNDSFHKDIFVTKDQQNGLQSDWNEVSF